MPDLQKIRQNLANKKLSLNLRAFAQQLSPELIDRAFNQQDPHAMEEVAQAVVKFVNGALSQLGVKARYGQTVLEDFRDQVLTQIFEYSLPRYDPGRGKLSTFIYNHVQNQWKSFQNTLIRSLKREQSLEDPVGGDEEGSMSLEQVLEDPEAMDFVSALEASQMYEELKGSLKDPRYQEIFRLWVDDTALNEELETLGLSGVERARTARQKSEDIAKIINSKFPDSPLSPVRVNRVIHDVVKDLVWSKYPEQAAWAEGEFRLPEEQPTRSVPVEEDEMYIPLEERPAPVFRIDPQTGERTQVSLNLRRLKIAADCKYAKEMWFNTLMTWLRIELNGKC